MIKFGSIRIYGVNRVIATDYGKYFFRTKTETAKKNIKTQRNKFNNLKKQAKQRFCDNINEHLDDLKTVNSKMYWKTIHMLLKNDRSTNELPPLHDPFNYFNLAYDATQKSNVLNKYFSSITKLNDDDAVLPDFHDGCENMLSQVIVTEQEVIDMLCTLNANNYTRSLYKSSTNRVVS